MNTSSDVNSHSADPTALNELFNLGRADTALPWTGDDLGAMLRHQLHQPLGPAPANAEANDGYTTRPHLDLFTQPAPPLARLRQVKDHAKSANENDADAALPRDVATVIYYAALAAARLHHPGQPISQLDDEACRVGFDWALQLSWLDPALKPLFSQAYDLAQGGGP